MDRLERLLDLVHVLQHARAPVTLTELKESFSDYTIGSDEAIRRKFERDKAELARIGLVLRYLDEDDEPGYVLDVEASYLPSLELNESERGVLATAAKAALADPSFPHRRGLRLALAKLGASVREDTVGRSVAIHHYEGGDADDHGRVEALGAALTARKRVQMVYRRYGAEHPTEREVDPYGLFLRAGSWYLVGFDHLREQVRIFRLSRIESAQMNDRKPAHPDFEVPADFDLKRMLGASPLHYPVHASTLAVIRIHSDVAFLAERIWGPPRADGLFEVETTNLGHLVDQVLSFGLRGELLEPPQARDAIRDSLQRVLAVHRNTLEEATAS